MVYRKYKDAHGQWRWRLRAGNNKVVADSGEGYWNEADCDHGIALNKSSFSAPVER
ncbi:MAG: DUF1508 domain-containing protein [Alphaproteobacteria bacterium]|nr:DUF1508 domain-containing protein [Alphaproteobacteria bacterium]